MFALVAMLLALALTVPCFAQTDRDGARHLTFNNQGEFAPFRSKPARELMSKTEFASYKRALADLDCTSANQILNTAFVRAYPVFRDARLGSHCPLASYCHHWRHYSRSSFFEYGYCKTIKTLAQLESDIRLRGYPQQKFKLKPGWGKAATNSYRNHWMKRRDLNLATLIYNAQSGYRPALIKLADLIRRGDLFKAGNDVEYFVLQRACLVGGGCRDLTHRVSELRSKIGDARATAIDNKARAKRAERPNLRQLVLGQKL